MVRAANGPRTTVPIRAAFVSDLHLGSRYCKAHAFYDFISSNEVDELYLVGDIIDGWRLARRWRWPDIYHRILRRLLDMQSAGTRLYYTPGNHDEFLRHYLRDFGIIELANEFIYESTGGKRILVLHGDRFDRVESCMPWLSIVGANAYEFLMWLNYSVNRVLRSVNGGEVHFSSRVKQSAKRAVQFISDFEEEVAAYARGKGCDGVICGHIHVPAVSDHSGTTYCNTGDWVEHGTALVEYKDGTWELTGVSIDGEDLLRRIGRGKGTCEPSVRDRRLLTATA